MNYDYSKRDYLLPEVCKLDAKKEPPAPPPTVIDLSTNVDVEAAMKRVAQRQRSAAPRSGVGCSALLGSAPARIAGSS